MLQTIAWPGFLIALVVFGFAPGVLLRMIVLCFPRDHPRRRELLAELRAVPRIERPFWVLEQLELAIFEGLWLRVRPAVEKQYRSRSRRSLRASPAEIKAAAIAGGGSAIVRTLEPAHEVDVAVAVRVTHSATVEIPPPPARE